MPTKILPYSPRLTQRLPPFRSVHRRHRVAGRQVLPAVVAVADAREELPGGADRHQHLHHGAPGRRRLRRHVLVNFQRIVSAAPAAAGQASVIPVPGRELRSNQPTNQPTPFRAFPRPPSRFPAPPQPQHPNPPEGDRNHTNHSCKHIRVYLDIDE